MEVVGLAGFVETGYFANGEHGEDDRLPCSAAHADHITNRSTR